MAYKYISEAWSNPEEGYLKDLMKDRLILWRKQPAIIRVERPTRLDRARRLGYKAKQGFVVVRVRVRRSTLRKKRPKAGRRQKRMGVSKIKPGKNIQVIAEERVARRYPNLTVLNSYYLGEDGRHKWFEVLAVDPHHPVIKADKNLNWTSDPSNRGRAFRGLTSAGKKMRGLRHKGFGAEKLRPSRKAYLRRKKAWRAKKKGLAA